MMGGKVLRRTLCVAGGQFFAEKLPGALPPPPFGRRPRDIVAKKKEGA